MNIFGILNLEAFAKQVECCRETVAYHARKGHWQRNGLPAADRIGQGWFFWPDAQLVLPVRKGGPGRPRGLKDRTKRRLGYPRIDRVIKKT